MKHREDAAQATLMKWARLTRVPVIDGVEGAIADYLHAIPNGGKRNAREAGRLKAQGVKAGVSDLFLPIKVKSYGGLWLEMKAARPHGSSVTASQKEWLSKMRNAGYAAVVAYGFDEAQAVITNYLNGEFVG